MSSIPELEAWTAIPARIHATLERLGGDGLDRVTEREGLTVREQIHHIVEANVVAASIVIAALGSPGCTYDWSWMVPFGPWMDRLHYRAKPLEPALHLLDALNAYVAAQIAPLPDALSREVYLKDGEDVPLRRATVVEVLAQEVAHAEMHLADVDAALST
jgi:hypothetical protein